MLQKKKVKWFFSKKYKSLLNTCQELIKTGAEIVVMGCTDIASTIGEKELKVPLINPVDILARAVIEYVTKQVQKRTKAD